MNGVINLIDNWAINYIVYAICTYYTSLTCKEVLVLKSRYSNVKVVYSLDYYSISSSV